MFGYNHPNLKELLGYPYLTWVIALATVRIVPEGAWRELATFGYHCVCVNLVVVPSLFLVKQFQEQMYSGEPSDPAPQQTAPVKAYLDMNKADAGGNVYAQATGGLRIDCIKKFNQTLIDQRNSNLVVDLSEGFWIKKIGDVEENRWTRIGGQGPTEFRTMLKRGEKFGAYKQTNGQGKWIVNPDGWKQVRRLANGEPLPQ